MVIIYKKKLIRKLNRTAERNLVASESTYVKCTIDVVNNY